MKQCPACNRTYANDKQKFCTQDGVALVDAHSASAGQGETVRIDSAELDDEITKAISKGLPRMTGSGFDPYKTTVSPPQRARASALMKHVLSSLFVNRSLTFVGKSAADICWLPGLR